MAGVDGGDQRGPAPVVGRAGPGPARPDRLPRRRRHDRADHRRTASRAWTCPTRGSGGMRPLIVSLANTKEVLYLVNRPGNAPSHAGRGGLDRQGDRPGDPARRTGLPARRHRLLADRQLRPVGRSGSTSSSAWTTPPPCAAAPKRWTSRRGSGWNARAGHDSPTGTTRARRETTSSGSSTERGYLDLRLNHEDVAEFDLPARQVHPPATGSSRCARTSAAARGEQVLIEEIRYFFYITTRTDPPPAQVVDLRQRALRPGEHHRPAQVRRERAARAGRTTWSPTGPTWSSPRWPGTSSPGSR